MITFRDGPAAGVSLQLRRAPLLLRVVQNPAGEWDALDMLLDEPAADESITVYQLDRDSKSRYHLLCRGGKSGFAGSGWFISAAYFLVADQPADEVMRSKPAWQEWATAYAEVMKS